MYQEGLLLLIPLSFRHIPPTPPMDPPLYSTQIVAGKKLCRVVCDGADSFIFFLCSGTESGTHTLIDPKSEQICSDSSLALELYGAGQYIKVYYVSLAHRNTAHRQPLSVPRGLQVPSTPLFWLAAMGR